MGGKIERGGLVLGFPTYGCLHFQCWERRASELRNRKEKGSPHSGVFNFLYDARMRAKLSLDCYAEVAARLNKTKGAAITEHGGVIIGRKSSTE